MSFSKMREDLWNLKKDAELDRCLAGRLSTMEIAESWSEGRRIWNGREDSGEGVGGGSSGVSLDMGLGSDFEVDLEEGFLDFEMEVE